MLEVGNLMTADQVHDARPKPIRSIQRFRPLPLQFPGPRLARCPTELPCVGLADHAGHETRGLHRIFDGELLDFDLEILRQ